ncbi:unnamed protein product [Ostreobium quekettii]|uniref:RING-type domain-containing protein n=1 Tax=Ostreobium quekettii TaxID=121088 RepID=A0A8S1IXK6_9CHLO|nr:unnamed protein product [Ostreobium quekettii]|eukprot:evm.model.scf_887.6 EVM.evm.TU.scf_887.6   scf_887:32685-34529(-)
MAAPSRAATGEGPALGADGVLCASPGRTCASTSEQHEGAGDWGASCECPTEGSCPICLQPIALVDLATVKDCGHAYCVYCILEWASVKEPATCPQCKREFSVLCCLRELDGTVTDGLHEESVCMLQRALWVQRRPAVEGADSSAPQGRQGPDDVFDDDYTYEVDDTEDYYFSNAAGSARIVLGNRRFGKNGYMRAGRVYAQPSVHDKNCQGGGQGKAQPGRPDSGQQQQGRRARRRAKRAEYD